VSWRQAAGLNLLADVRSPALKPSLPQLGGESLFGLHALRLLHRQVCGHLIDPGRHPVGQSPFDGEVGRMARLACGKFGGLFFGPQLGGRELRLKSFNMGFEGSDELAGERSFVGATGRCARPSIRTTSFQPSGGRIRVRLSLPSVFCHRPRFARCRTASVDTLSISAACRYVNHSPVKMSPVQDVGPSCAVTPAAQRGL
jgi:hypothetical protein